MAADLTPIEDLDRRILDLCTGINAATCELLVLIREFDERTGWLQWGLQSCAKWLAWRCDLSMTTAREKVRVAHALKDLPVMCKAFPLGELSYAKVRELTRVANRDNEETLVEFALRHTAVHHLVIIHVDYSALAGDGGRAAVPLESVKRHCCHGHAVVLAEDDTGEPLSIGRKSRLVPKGIERAVRPRSIIACCRAPGITRWCTREASESTRTFWITGVSNGPTAWVCPRSAMFPGWMKILPREDC